MQLVGLNVDAVNRLLLPGAVLHCLRHSPVRATGWSHEGHVRLAVGVVIASPAGNDFAVFADIVKATAATLLVVGRVVIEIDIPILGHDLIVRGSARVASTDELRLSFDVRLDWAGNGAGGKDEGSDD